MYMALNGIVFVKHLLTHSVSFRILYSGLCDTWTQFALVQSECVDGLQEIHKKIMSLNFIDCHARICQVDCQSSVAGSVVVQV